MALTVPSLGDVGLRHPPSANDAVTPRQIHWRLWETKSEGSGGGSRSRSRSRSRSASRTPRLADRNEVAIPSPAKGYAPPIHHGDGEDGDDDDDDDSEAHRLSASEPPTSRRPSRGAHSACGGDSRRGSLLLSALTPPPPPTPPKSPFRGAVTTTAAAAAATMGAPTPGSPSSPCSSSSSISLTAAALAALEAQRRHHHQPRHREPQPVPAPASRRADDDGEFVPTPPQRQSSSTATPRPASPMPATSDRTLEEAPSPSWAQRRHGSRDLGDLASPSPSDAAAARVTDAATRSSRSHLHAHTDSLVSDSAQTMEPAWADDASAVERLSYCAADGVRGGTRELGAPWQQHLHDHHDRHLIGPAPSPSGAPRVTTEPVAEARGAAAGAYDLPYSPHGALRRQQDSERDVGNVEAYRQTYHHHGEQDGVSCDDGDEVGGYELSPSAESIEIAALKRTVEQLQMALLLRGGSPGPTTERSGDEADVARSVADAGMSATTAAIMRPPPRPRRHEARQSVSWRRNSQPHLQLESQSQQQQHQPQPLRSQPRKQQGLVAPQAPPSPYHRQHGYHYGVGGLPTPTQTDVGGRRSSSPGSAPAAAAVISAGAHGSGGSAAANHDGRPRALGSHWDAEYDHYEDADEDDDEGGRGMGARRAAIDEVMQAPRRSQRAPSLSGSYAEQPEYEVLYAGGSDYHGVGGGGGGVSIDEDSASMAFVRVVPHHSQRPSNPPTFGHNSRASSPPPPSAPPPRFPTHTHLASPLLGSDADGSAYAGVPASPFSAGAPTAIESAKIDEMARKIEALERMMGAAAALAAANHDGGGRGDASVAVRSHVRDGPLGSAPRSNQGSVHVDLAGRVGAAVESGLAMPTPRLAPLSASRRSSLQDATSAAPPKSASPFGTAPSPSLRHTSAPPPPLPPPTTTTAVVPQAPLAALPPGRPWTRSVGPATDVVGRRDGECDEDKVHVATGEKRRVAAAATTSSANYHPRRARARSPAASAFHFNPTAPFLARTASSSSSSRPSSLPTAATTTPRRASGPGENVGGATARGVTRSVARFLSHVGSARRPILSPGGGGVDGSNSSIRAAAEGGEEEARYHHRDEGAGGGVGEEGPLGWRSLRNAKGYYYVGDVHRRPSSHAGGGKVRQGPGRGVVRVVSNKSSKLANPDAAAARANASPAAHPAAAAR